MSRHSNPPPWGPGLRAESRTTSLRFVVGMLVIIAFATVMTLIEQGVFKATVYDPNCLNCHAPATSVYGSTP